MPSLRPVPDAPPRAIAYVRVSDEGGRGEDLISPEIQMTAIRDHCARNGYEIVEVLEDIDRTGKLWCRRQIEHAVAQIEARAADVIVVWKISRVSRNRRDWAIAVDRVEGSGGRLESATEALDTSTSTGRFARGMLAELAAFESERLGESWREAHHQRMMRGLPHSGVKRLGYTYDHATGYTIDPDEAPIVREMFLRYASGRGPRSISTWLNSIGFRTTRGNGWSDQAVKGTLHSGFAAGLLRRRTERCGCPTPAFCGHHEYLPGAHEPIITEQEWAGYQVERARRERQPVRDRRPRLLSGLVVCAGCGRRCSATDSGTTWSCPKKRGMSAMGVCEVRASVTDRVARELVCEWLPTVAGVVDEAAAAMPGPAALDAMRQQLERQILATDAALVRLTTGFARELIPEAAFRSASAALTAELAGFRAELDALPDPESYAGATRAAHHLLEHWEHGDPVELNSVLRELCRVVVSRDMAQPSRRPWGHGGLLVPRVMPVWETRAPRG